MRLSVTGTALPDRAKLIQVLQDAGHVVGDSADLEIVITQASANPAQIVSALKRGHAAVRRYKTFVVRVPKAQRRTTSGEPRTEPAPDRSEPSEVIRKLRRSVYLAFDRGYIRYAAALTHSVLELNPGWTVRAFATNVPESALSTYPWTSDRVSLIREDRTFASAEEQRIYMATSRFRRYRTERHRDDVVVMLDADMICLGRFDGAVEDMLKHAEDVAIIQRPQLEERRRVRACTVVSLRTGAADAFWDCYDKLLPDKPTWYDDQIALVKALRTPGLKVRSLPESVW